MVQRRRFFVTRFAWYRYFNEAAPVMVQRRCARGCQTLTGLDFNEAAPVMVQRLRGEWEQVGIILTSMRLHR